MSRATHWVTGLVGSGLVHGVFAGIYLATRALEPTPQQQGPQSALELATFTAPTEKAQEQAPESEAAEQAEVDSTAVGADSIAQSSATPLTAPSAQAQQIENPAQKAEALAPKGASVDVSSAEGSTSVTPLLATPQAVAALEPQTSVTSAVTPQSTQTPAQQIETPPVVAAVVPEVTAAVPAVLAAQAAAVAAPNAFSATLEDPSVQVAALSVPTAEPISQAVPKAQIIAVAAPAPEIAALSIPKVDVTQPAVPDAQTAVLTELDAQTAAPTRPETQTAAAATPTAQTAALSRPDTQIARIATPQAQTVAQATPEAQVAAPAAPNAQTAPAAPTNAPTATPAALPATSAKADTAFQFGDRLVTDPKALATIQAFMAPETLEGSDQVRDDLGSVLTDVDCARLSAVFIPETGNLEMRGHVPDLALRADVIAAMQQQVGADIPVTANLLHLPSPQCGALTGIADLGLPQSTDQFTNTRLIGETAHAREYGYSEGQRLEFDLAAPDYDAYVYVDYFTATGDVVHLVPNETIPLEKTTAKTAFGVGKDRPGKPGLLITIGPPFGQEIAVAFAASHPLYDGLRPLVEPADPYLADLKARVAAARAQHPDFKGEWVYFFITTSPS